MLGGIIGDIVGAPYEFLSWREPNFQPFIPSKAEFTDDTVLTVATIDALVNNNLDFAGSYKAFGNEYPNMTWGTSFKKWLNQDNPQPYGSWGNGAVMRVSPIILYADTLPEAIQLGEKSSKVSHNHPNAIWGVRCVIEILFELRNGGVKEDVEKILKRYYPDYEVNFKNMDYMRQYYTYSEATADTVPASVLCLLGADSFEEAIRNACSIGGDADTLACVTGSMAEMLFHIPDDILDKVFPVLPDNYLHLILGLYKRFTG